MNLGELFAKWAADLPGFILAYLALFGIPRAGIHGFLSALWKLAENVAGVRNEIKGDFAAVRQSQAKIEAGIAEIKEEIKKPGERGRSIQLNLD